MTDEERIIQLETVLAQFLKPIKNIPFAVIVKSLAGHVILPINKSDQEDERLIEALIETAHLCGELVKAKPIVRSRPNEVGNDIEPFLMAAAKRCGLRVERPVSGSGVGKSTGYPDVLIFDEKGRPTYLECKSYAAGSALTTMRSFFLSPSDEFKISRDARHLLMAFAMISTPVPGTKNSAYLATGFKLIDLSGLLCDVKYEFNSDNKRLYSTDRLLATGDF